MCLVSGFFVGTCIFVLMPGRVPGDNVRNFLYILGIVFERFRSFKKGKFHKTNRASCVHDLSHIDMSTSG